MVEGIACIGWGLLIGIAIYGFRAGMARTLCLSLTVLLASLFSLLLAPLGIIIAPTDEPSMQTAVTGLFQAGLFLAFLILLLPVVRLLSRVVVFTVEPFEYAAGLALGLALGLYTAHTFLASAAHGGELLARGGAVNRLYLVRQLVYMDGWQQMKGFIGGLGAGERTQTYQEHMPVESNTRP
jgi:hypothetical protein